MLRPACRAVMNSKPCTAQAHTEAQRTKGNYDRTTSLHRAGGGAAAVGPDGRAADASANADAQGRRKLPFFVDPIERKLKIEKADLISIYLKRQVQAQRNLRPE